MAQSNIIKTASDNGLITLIDGTSPTPLTLVVRYDKANFSVELPKISGRDRTVIAARGKLRSVRKAAPVFPTCSFGCQVADLVEDTEGTYLDWVYKRGVYAARVSTMAALGDEDAFHVQFTQEGTALGDDADQTILVKDFSPDGPKFSEDENGNSIDANGTYFGDVEINGDVVFERPVA